MVALRVFSLFSFSFCRTSLLLARRGVNVVTRASSSAKRDFSGAAAAVRAKEEVAAPSGYPAAPVCKP